MSTGTAPARGKQGGMHLTGRDFVHQVDLITPMSLSDVQIPQFRETVEAVVQGQHQPAILDPLYEPISRRAAYVLAIRTTALESVHQEISEETATATYYALFGFTGGIQALLERQGVTEIIVDGRTITYYEQGIVQTLPRALNDDDLRRITDYISHLCQQRNVASFSTQRPWVTLGLPGGHRLGFSGEPLIRNGLFLSIRLALRSSGVDMLGWLELRGTIPTHGRELLTFLVQNGASVLCGGLMAAGKTTAMRAMLDAFPPDQRIAVLEDVAEIVLDESRHPKTLYVLANNEPDRPAGWSLLDQARAQRRMKGEVLVIGETLGAEAEAVISAARVAQVFTGVHGRTPQRAVEVLLEYATQRGTSYAGREDWAAKAICEDIGLIAHLALVPGHGNRLSLWAITSWTAAAGFTIAPILTYTIESTTNQLIWDLAAQVESQLAAARTASPKLASIYERAQMLRHTVQHVLDDSRTRGLKAYARAQELVQAAEWEQARAQLRTAYPLVRDEGVRTQMLAMLGRVRGALGEAGEDILHPLATTFLAAYGAYDWERASAIAAQLTENIEACYALSNYATSGLAEMMVRVDEERTKLPTIDSVLGRAEKILEHGHAQEALDLIAHLDVHQLDQMRGDRVVRLRLLASIQVLGRDDGTVRILTLEATRRGIYVPQGTEPPPVAAVPPSVSSSASAPPPQVPAPSALTIRVDDAAADESLPTPAGTSQAGVGAADEASVLFLRLQALTRGSNGN